MKDRSDSFHFVGSGYRHELDVSLIHPWEGEIRDWIPGENRLAEPDVTAPGHPAGYIASSDLADAVNTALILSKPLLLTGNPGTGKTELAERVAWEFNLGPVLRFESQSLSEATDLFYRFDLLRQVATRQPGYVAKNAGTIEELAEFLSFGPLGKAIIRSNPKLRGRETLWDRAFPGVPMAQASVPSVVLIDEIDKATRDFPNDLLNAIERLEVPIREIPGSSLRTEPESGIRPIIIITSNSERELPPPFLRRCVYCHIDDPDEQTLRRIVKTRVFPETIATEPESRAPGSPLPPLFEDMLQFFVREREQKGAAMSYSAGPSELIDWSRAVRQSKDHAAEDKMDRNHAIVRRAFAAFAKHRDDRSSLLDSLGRFIDGTVQ